MLATMPCTLFPGREAYRFQSITTDHCSISTMEYSNSVILRRRPSKRVAMSTCDFEAMVRGFERESGVVEILFVEWLFLCWLDMDEKS